MKRLIPALLALSAPAAFAWPSCDQAGLAPPVAIQREAPPYPAAVREIGIEGSVEVALTILRDGSVGWISVVHADPPGYFEQAAAAGVRGWRFEPARQHGVPVECRMLTRLRFTLVDTVDAAGRPVASKDRPDPVYPARMMVDRIEGYAELEFELAADGSVREPRVIMAMPRGEFELAALAAIRSWRFPAGSEAQRMTRRFEFRLPDSTLGDVPPITLASAPFPKLACEQRQTGRVSLEVETDATGRIRKARILSAEPKDLFDRSALAIARGSRMTPAYREGQPIPAIALLTLFFDPGQASCPGSLKPDPKRPPPGPPPPAVSGHDERPAGRGDLFASLSAAGGQQVTLGNRRHPAALQ
ncbi:MAG: TonB family protein [Steroidobacteraceae bacterium]